MNQIRVGDIVDTPDGFGLVEKAETDCSNIVTFSCSVGGKILQEFFEHEVSFVKSGQFHEGDQIRVVGPEDELKKYGIEELIGKTGTVMSLCSGNFINDGVAWSVIFPNDNADVWVKIRHMELISGITPKNNDKRKSCFWCGGNTKKVNTGFKFWDVCEKCGK